jgi:hypothetical protein
MVPVRSTLDESQSSNVLRRNARSLGGAPLDDARLGIVKYFTSLRCCPSITCRIRLAEPIGQRLSAWIADATFTAPSRAGTST